MWDLQQRFFDITQHAPDRKLFCVTRGVGSNHNKQKERRKMVKFLFSFRADLENFETLSFVEGKLSAFHRCRFCVVFEGKSL